MIAVKTYFININSFTKVKSRFQNSDLEVLQFDIPLKCKQHEALKIHLDDSSENLLYKYY